MKRLTTLLLCALLAPSAAAQTAAQVRARITDPRLPQLLDELSRDAQQRPLTRSDLNSFRQRGVAIDAQARVHVEIIAPEGTPIDAAPIIEPHEGVLTGSYRNVAEAWLPARELRNLLADLPPAYHVVSNRAPQLDDIVGEGPDVQNTAAWRDASSDGGGPLAEDGPPLFGTTTDGGSSSSSSSSSWTASN